MSAMTYPQPPQPEEPSKPLARSLTVQSAGLGAALVIIATLLQGGVIAPSWPAESRSQIAAVLISLAAASGFGVAVGARRAIGALLLAIALSACCGPDLRPTVREARITLEHLRTDYATGRLTIPGAQPATLERLRAARLAEIDAAIANMSRAEEGR
jgi:hypothetical protein